MFLFIAPGPLHSVLCAQLSSSWATGKLGGSPNPWTIAPDLEDRDLALGGDAVHSAAHGALAGQARDGLRAGTRCILRGEGWDVREACRPVSLACTCRTGV